MRSLALLIGVSGLGLARCSGEKPSCGEGTHLEGSTCVADETPGADSGVSEGEGAGEGEGSAEGEGAEGEGAEGEGEGTEGEGEGTEGEGEGEGSSAATVCATGGTFTTIQEALDVAAADDTITVCPGTYAETLIATVPLTLESTDGSDVTILDAGYADTALKVRGGGEFHLKGFTVRDGSADIGAIDAEGIDLDLQDVAVEDNEGSTAIVSLEGGSLTSDLLRVEGNSLRDEGFLLLVDNGDAELIHARFLGNLDPDTSTTTYAAAFESAGTVTLDNSVFYNGDAIQPVWIDGADGLTVINSVFYNVAFGVYASGGGLYEFHIENSVFTGGEYDYAYGLGGYLPDSYSVEYTLYSDLSMLVCCSGDTDPTNIDDYPRFVDPDSGDFSLETTSPAIDAGDPAAAFNDVDGSRNDLGIYGGPWGAW